MGSRVTLILSWHRHDWFGTCLGVTGRGGFESTAGPSCTQLHGTHGTPGAYIVPTVAPSPPPWPDRFCFSSPSPGRVWVEVKLLAAGNGAFLQSVFLVGAGVHWWVSGGYLFIVGAQQVGPLGREAQDLDWG